jgi:hypothetical protein
MGTACCGDRGQQLDVIESQTQLKITSTGQDLQQELGRQRHPSRPQVNPPTVGETLSSVLFLLPRLRHLSCALSRWQLEKGGTRSVTLPPLSFPLSGTCPSSGRSFITFCVSAPLFSLGLCPPIWDSGLLSLGPTPSFPPSPASVSLQLACWGPLSALRPLFAAPA